MKLTINFFLNQSNQNQMQWKTLSDFLHDPAMVAEWSESLIIQIQVENTIYFAMPLISL